MYRLNDGKRLAWPVPLTKKCCFLCKQSNFVQAEYRQKDDLACTCYQIDLFFFATKKEQSFTGTALLL